MRGIHVHDDIQGITHISLVNDVVEAKLQKAFFPDSNMPEEIKVNEEWENLSELG